jgi:hypothetical protein
MTHSELPGSLRERLDRVYPFEAVADAELDVLLQQGVTALASAIEGGGERGGAFDLLMADACLTEACARALEAGDPRAELARILEAIGGVATR